MADFEYDEDTHREYSSSLQEHGFDEMPHEDGVGDAIEELLNDMENLPEKIQNLLEYMLQGYDIADAAYYAGYGNNTETLHKVLKKDTGHGVKEKLKVFKTAHGAGKEKARTKKFSAQ